MAVDEQAEREIAEAADRLYASVSGNARRLAMLAAQFQRAARGTKADTMEVSGGLSALSGKPYVELRLPGDFVLQLTVDDARSHALLILEAAECAVGDETVYRLALDVLQMDNVEAARFVGKLRDVRRDRWGGSGTEDHDRG